MSVIQQGSTWKSFERVKNLFIFGDSYSSVGFGNKLNNPDELDPLGIEFPGLTYNEPKLPNWVGHLITKYCPPPRFDPQYVQQSEEYHKEPLLVYDYAVGGDRVLGVRGQVHNRYLRGPGAKPEGSTWTAENSLFVTWVGINDCAFAQKHAKNMETLFGLQEDLYQSGARNFLFVDVPPVNRSPAAPAGLERSPSIENWNEELAKAIKAFVEVHQDISAFFFSSSELFTKVLDNPEEYGFTEKDKRKAGGSIWADRLHPTSKVHDLIAKEVGEFLSSIECSTS
ncbi:hypothetical protein BDN72DRAFT_830957 [Pluteus cervinus]|uniref:Uncharacterized protein n=1 Tax=Pluteus cervinus TaxID=181527 RepID=A0ACD3BFK2_9AGAR|nr:hypothetical protein BDN72DRAFT_830957 [Pluteus cervinus]